MCWAYHLISCLHPLTNEQDTDLQEMIGLYRACPKQGQRLILASTRAMAHELMDADIDRRKG